MEKGSSSNSRITRPNFFENVGNKLKDFIHWGINLLKIFIKYLYSYWPELVVFILLGLLAWGIYKDSSIRSFVAAFRPGPPATATPVPKATPTPPTNTIYLQLAADDVAQLDSFGDATFPASKAQLLLVVKQTISVRDGGSLVRHTSEKFCVTVNAFLDADHVRLTRYDETKAKSVLVSLKLEDLARYSVAKADKEQMYLVPDSGCTD